MTTPSFTRSTPQDLVRVGVIAGPGGHYARYLGQYDEPTRGTNPHDRYAADTRLDH